MFSEKMDKVHTICLAFGICVFITVIYLLSSQSGIRKLRPFEQTKLDNIKENSAKRRPNFILILTDDQDSIMGSSDHMEYVKKYIKDQGVEFKNSFVASPLCCPSRSSIFSGQYVHNHKAFNNSINGGCSSKTWQKGTERKSFVSALHNSDYVTFFAGKYLNQYGKNEVGGLKHIPSGWDWWIGLEGNSRYFNYTLSVNGSREEHGDNTSRDYLTNIIKKRAIEFLQIVSHNSNPFFMMLSTPACHAPFDFEPKYENNFTNFQIPRTKNFNIVNDKSKHWLLRLGDQPLGEELIDKIDEIYRKRLRTLLSVDIMVKEIIDVAKDKGLLSSTYIIFTSDNGYHLGQFSLPLDKREPYEFDIRVPFYISGPQISQKVLKYPIINIDIAPTILDLAGIPIPKYFDGESLKPLLKEKFNTKPALNQAPTYHLGSIKNTLLRKTLLIEHKGEGSYINKGCEYLGSNLGDCNPDYDCKCSDSKNNTYSCLRHMSEFEDFLFCVWKDNEHFEEFYDLETDFYQLNNTVKYLSNERHHKLHINLSNLKKCRGSHCNKLSKFVF